MRARTKGAAHGIGQAPLRPDIVEEPAPEGPAAQNIVRDGQRNIVGIRFFDRQMAHAHVRLRRVFADEPDGRHRRLRRRHIRDIQNRHGSFRPVTEYLA